MQKVSKFKKKKDIIVFCIVSCLRPNRDFLFGERQGQTCPFFVLLNSLPPLFYISSDTATTSYMELSVPTYSCRLINSLSSSGFQLKSRRTSAFQSSVVFPIKQESLVFPSKHLYGISSKSPATIPLSMDSRGIIPQASENGPSSTTSSEMGILIINSSFSTCFHMGF